MLTPIPADEFVRRTEIDLCRDLHHSWSSAGQVVSMRALDTIEAVQLMPIGYLMKLLEHTVILGGNRERVYAGCTVSIMQVSPQAVRIGQRFIQRSKYTAILENFGSILGQFSIQSGISGLGAFIILGKTKDGTPSVAHYVPPIAEMNGSTKWNLLDGLHRNFLINQIGATTTMVAIEGVKVPFPCTLHDWKVIKPVDEKPPKEERYFDLKPELFRSLEYVGIDG